jgi:hypothetical protein
MPGCQDASAWAFSSAEVDSEPYDHLVTRVGFSPERLLNLSSQAGCRLVKCVYDHKQQSDLMNELLMLCLTSFRQD